MYTYTQMQTIIWKKKQKHGFELWELKQQRLQGDYFAGWKAVNTAHCKTHSTDRFECGESMNEWIKDLDMSKTYEMSPRLPRIWGHLALS